MFAKRGLGVDVLIAARQRIGYVFDTFERVYVSFSGGKDSTVLLHLAAEEADRRGRKLGVLFIDLEAQYRLTIEHVARCYDLYADVAEPYWVALPLMLRNAVSQYEPRWVCWEPGREKDWVRKPDRRSITDPGVFPFYRHAMEFEEFTDPFGHWYGGGALTACLVGIRADESLNRWRTVAYERARFRGLKWTTFHGHNVYNCYPLYDWRTRDVWVYSGKSGKPYNGLYTLMHRAGLSIHQQRICQPYGDDQRRGLWLYHLIEPETWGRVVARVNGANSGALYARESGNVLGNLKITKPDGHTWESFARLLLASQPAKTREHFEAKIATFLAWYRDRGYPQGIPDEADPKEEASRKVPSWRRVCKALLKNDYWCKGLSFSQTLSTAYENYRRIMKKRMQRWGYYERGGRP